jgi:hypothetical protein
MLAIITTLKKNKGVLAMSLKKIKIKIKILS